MKKILFLIAALAACIQVSATPLLNILQVEYIRNGGYRPQSKAPFTDFTIPATAEYAAAYSDHATTVAQLWQANGTLALVKTWYIEESTNFEVKYLYGGKTFAPQVAQWHLIILPFGDGCTWSLDADKKLAVQCERDNVLALVSPPDAGMTYFPFPCNAVSPCILHVASSTTGSYLTGEVAPEIYSPVAWNSYVQPSMVSSGIAQIIDWLLQNQISYRSSDIKTIILATALSDSQGRKIFNGSAALAAVKAKYGPPVPQPPPIVPVVVPIEPDQAPSPVPTPTPVPVTTTTDNGSPQINSWGHWNSAWTSASTPTTFYWTATHCAGVTITDPTGKSIQEPATGTLTVTSSCSGAQWTIAASNNGQTVSRTDLVHGCF